MFSPEKFTTVNANRGFVSSTHLLEKLFTLNKVRSIHADRLGFCQKVSAAMPYGNYLKSIKFLALLTE